tara:strand:+ start:9557 stop:10387 length:831 start_codon:yes stop_codon:yes gene_type:complete
VKLKHVIRKYGIKAMDASGASLARRMYLRKKHSSLSRIVCFHKISNKDAFEKKILLLTQNFHIVPLDLIVENVGLHEKITNLAITFDDGFLEQIDLAAPILKKYDVPATFFILSGSIGLSGETAAEFYRTKVGIDYAVGPTEKQIFELASDPLFQIGCHTHTHLDLGKESDSRKIYNELTSSKSILEGISRSEICHLAYPFGSKDNYSAMSEGMVLQAGFKSASTIIPGYISENTPRTALHRDSLDPEMKDSLFLSWLNGSYDTIKAFSDRLGVIK